MIFLTVGTLFEFDRLIRAVDNLVRSGRIEEDVFAQIGTGLYKPHSMKSVDILDKTKFEEIIQQSSALISHAGMGSISMAIKYNKSLLVMPRLKKYGEHVNDHQLHTAEKFEQLGHILAAYDENELIDKIKLLKTFIPKPRIPNRQGVIDRVGSFLRMLENERL
jgi:UDP-N-acetylglucosamine transferase subunit ALG13